MDIPRLSLGASIGLILRHRRLLPKGLALLKAAITEFFIPQFESRLRPGIRPIAVVAHPLDRSIPFVSNRIAGYLGYITLWLKTLLCLYRRFGAPVLPDIEQMIRDVTTLYYASGKVYRRCQSTTTSRPARPLNPYFLVIRLFDPHLHCIPSLHILTMCYNYHQTSKIAGRLSPPEGSGCGAAAQTRRLAVEITEAVLLVKQHSLIDIGSSLFLLSRLFPEYDRKEIDCFVGQLFAGSPHVSPQTGARIREAILASYREMLDLEYRYRHAEPAYLVLSFLKRYCPEQTPAKRPGRQPV
jgi:hypothetical protein